MGRLNLANLKKTIYYLERNGLVATIDAVRERLDARGQASYTYVSPSEEELSGQRRGIPGMSELFSILVPAYRTKEAYLEELIASLIAQTYPHWELILADSTEDDSVEQVVRRHSDERIRYLRLAENAGISENTNRALEEARGAYIGLLDHDDLLTPDALYHMAQQLSEGSERNQRIGFLYSDEDKCDGEGKSFYDPHYKEDFNLDLLLSNNYICHFLVMESSLMKTLRFRREFDGAQDFDLVLRAVAQFIVEDRETLPERIVHIHRVLYHWRCHEASTAANPRSKAYAYMAGRRAVEDFVSGRKDWKGIKVEDTPHVGFYRLTYEEDIFASRPDVGCVGGKVIATAKSIVPKGSILAGRYGETGEVFYRGMPARYSGYMNRMAMQQDAAAVDLRCIKVRRECYALFEQTVGVTYTETPREGIFDAKTLSADADVEVLSCKLGKALGEAGYRILWDPAMKHRI